MSSPQHICGYEFISWLKPQQTALCRSHTGAALVVKQLDADCVLAGDVHPDVRERLARIRELPHRQVATLVSVERDAEGTIYLVWEYVEGLDLHSWCISAEPSSQQIERMFRETQLAVQQMHVLGIVHGSITRHNIIVDATGQLHMVDPSPLLYTDPHVDLGALEKLFEEIRTARGEEAPAVAPGADGAVVDDADEMRVRRRTLRLAALVLLLSAVVALLAWYVLYRLYEPVTPLTR